jgi:hypothetical protein
LVPTIDGGDDFVGVGVPDEGLGVMVGLGDEAVDGGLKIDDGVKDVKWKTKRGWRASRALTFGCLWVA